MRSADFAAVIPAGLPEIARLLGGIEFNRTWATREGIVIACEHKEWSHKVQKESSCAGHAQVYKLLEGERAYHPGLPFNKLWNLESHSSI
jgi:hypothetical protein